MSTTAVGLGELKLSREPGDVLVCYGLGSCIGVAIYDPLIKIAALVHVVLPESSLNRKGTDLPGKYADTAIPATLEALVRLGASPSRMLVRYAGGARMLNVAGLQNRLDIGARNADAVRMALEKMRLRVQATDTGGSHGRTISLYVDSGKLIVSTVGRGERAL